jgi:hypothetical protein
VKTLAVHIKPTITSGTFFLSCRQAKFFFLNYIRGFLAMLGAFPTLVAVAALWIAVASPSPTPANKITITKSMRAGVLSETVFLASLPAR